MKLISVLAALLLPVAAQAERAMLIRLEWLNHAERECKGCSTQLITYVPDNELIVCEECVGGKVCVKVEGRWKGDAIEVSLTPQVREGEKFVADGPSKSVVVAGEETRQIELLGIKFGVSAGPAPEERPNQSPEPTGMLVTPRADARVAPSTPVAHL